MQPVTVQHLTTESLCGSRCESSLPVASVRSRLPHCNILIYLPASSLRSRLLLCILRSYLPHRHLGSQLSPPGLAVVALFPVSTWPYLPVPLCPGRSFLSPRLVVVPACFRASWSFLPDSPISWSLLAFHAHSGRAFLSHVSWVSPSSRDCSSRTFLIAASVVPADFPELRAYGTRDLQE